MAMTLITTNIDTPGSATDSAFTSGIDNTYKLYILKWYDVNPGTDDVNFTFNGSTDGGSSYDVTKATTHWSAYHAEDNGYAAMGYGASQDLSDSDDGTAFQPITGGIANDADASSAGELFLFNPSNTTYVKHFYYTANSYKNDSASANTFTGGYFNTTSAIDAIVFRFTSGDFTGTIKMYGVG
jgi:hypothetical protein